ncbi:hypothetical protein EHYA_08770 [Embleya hyalina]|uniref:AAA+ ATPase domain-containing protein n=1 Tax=Embleya hyalina TaxID=516124 RepID=A0A401Z2K1_9ACTN|nr:hypothetical protein EHYA_08770 [Embleya hyalina]
MFEKIQAILRTPDDPLLAEGILDTLWLAARLGHATTPLARLHNVRPSTPHRAESPPGIDAPPRPAPTTGHTAVPAIAVPPPLPRQRGHDGPGGRGGRTRPAVPVSLPSERPLSRELDIGQALHGLKRTRPSPVRNVLDEIATAEALAAGNPHPVLRPAKERWLRLALVVDGGPSMLLWRRLTTHLRQILERTGAFRHIQVHGLLHPSSRSEPLALVRPFETSGVAKSPHGLVDPSGQTMVLLVTDGAGNGWKDGRMRTVVDDWARIGPTAVIQTLPSQLWDGSSLRAAPWLVHAEHPGSPNTAWRVTHPALPIEHPDDRAPVPVLDLTPAALTRWAHAVTARQECVELPLWTDVVAGTGDIVPPSPRARLEHFVRAASPEAKHLAGHLAAMAPLTIPVMDLVRSALFGEAGTVPLAEVVLAGLLKSFHPPDHARGAIAPPDQAFTFDDDIGPLLAETVPPRAVGQCAAAISARLEELAGKTPGFPAWLYGPGETPPPGAPFAEIRNGSATPPSATHAPRPGKPLGPSWTPHVLTSLPPIHHDMTGRGPELNLLLDALAPHDDESESQPPECVLLRGLPGVGKTTLALTAARVAQARRWFDTFLTLDLHDDVAPALERQALEALLVALGIPDTRIPHSTGHRTDLYRRTLATLADQGRRVLVTVDNVLPTIDWELLLPGRPHRLVLCAEQPVAEGLVPQITLDRLLPPASLALIDESLRAADPRDTRVEEHPEDARALAALCGHLPLALRIAAGRLVAEPRQPIADLVHRIRHTNTSHATDTALTAVLHESYGRLTADEALTFRLMSVHPGPDISLEAAIVLLDTAHDTARRRLRRLVAAGLLHLVATPTSSPRLAMHDLVRAHAQHLRDHLSPSHPAEHTTAQRRILRYYASAADTAVQRLTTHQGLHAPQEKRPAPDETRSTLTWLDAERACLIAMVHVAVDTGEHVELALTLGPYLEQRRHFEDWHTVSTMARDFYRRVNDTPAEAAAWNNLGQALRGQRRFDESTSALQRAEDLFARVDDPRGEATAANNLGVTLHLHRRHTDAVDALERAALLQRRIDDPHGLADTLNNLGLALYELGRSDEARSALLEAEHLAFDSGDTRTLAFAANNLGLALRRAGNLDEALAAHRRALALQQRRTDDQPALAQAHGNLGLLLWDMGRHEDALHELRLALELFTHSGDRHGQAIAWNNLGLALTDTRRFEEAADAHQSAFELFRSMADTHGQASAQDNRGVTLRRLGRLDEARHAHTQAADLFSQAGDYHSQACALANLGTALLESDDLVSAHRVQADAHQLFTQSGDRTNEAFALANLCGTLLRMGDIDDASTHMARAIELLRDDSDRHNEAIIWQKLALVLQATDRDDEALAAHEQAVHAARLSRDPHLEATLTANYATAQARSGHTDEALTLFEAAEEAFARADDPVSAQRIGDLREQTRARHVGLVAVDAARADTPTRQDAGDD